jgi:lipopolysaccharide biosynthesis regulator YciM
MFSHYLPAAVILPAFIILLALVIWKWRTLRDFCRRIFRRCLPFSPAATDDSSSGSEETSRLLKSYFKGLSYVLANETDKAVAEFVKVANVNTTTAEIYLALGQLFRNSGELERAIRVHRDILLRPNLPEEIRRQTFFEIGLDYKKAGFLERALSTFEEILDREPKNQAARRELLTLYISLREWEKALDLYLSFPDNRDEKNIIAHLHTEVAKVAEAAGDRKKALKFFRQALDHDENCIDAWLHYGDFLLVEDRLDQTLEAWDRAFTLNPDFIALVTGRFSSLPEAERDRVEADFFARHLEKYGTRRKFNLAYIAFLVKKGELAEAGERLKKIMAQKSGDAEVFALVRDLLEKIRQEKGDESPLYKELVYDFFSTQLRFEKPYLCRRCGYQLERMSWRCPRCTSWDTVAIR